MIRLHTLSVMTNIFIEGAADGNVFCSSDTLHMIGKIPFRFRKQFPDMARHIFEGDFEALGCVLLRHMGFAFHYSDVNRFLASIH